MKQRNKYSRRVFFSILNSTPLLASAASLLRASTPALNSGPNVIFILADDLGWNELGCYGNTFNETPNLDILAGQGMRFTDAYASAPVCSPYRAALMTGMYPARIGITDYLRPDSNVHLSEKYTTMAEMFKLSGYTTGIIGKWHLTGYAKHGAKEVPPSKHGFDETIVSENKGIGGGSYFHPYHFNVELEKRLPGKENLIDRMNLEAVEFIDRNKNRPFFLYLSHYAVHTKLSGKDERVNKYLKKPGAGKDYLATKNNPHLAAQLEGIDQGAGMIMKKLDDLNLSQNTILIFTSDNGGQSGPNRNITAGAPLRGGKSQLYEAGIREPLIVRWPGVVQNGTVCNEPVANIDFYPTFMDCINSRVKPGQKMDGVSFKSLLKNPKSKLNRDALYWHYPLSRPHFLGGRSTGAIRKGDYKLIEYFDTNHFELYNLANDIGEKNNLLDKLPKKAAELKNALAHWREESGITIPDNCKNYDPKDPKFKKKKKKK